MQRKNRGPNEDSTCLGTDLNRNYDSSWGGKFSSGIPSASILCSTYNESIYKYYLMTINMFRSISVEGVSHDPCNADVYCGDNAVSELETEGIQNEIQKITGVRNILAFIDVHTFGQIIFIPYR